jgi:prepilin-type N-terminal cleavage/methylation domain-containing protein
MNGTMMMMMRMNIDMKGFTLMELVITLMILGILTSIAIGVSRTDLSSPRVWMTNGTFCENGLQWASSNGYAQQVIGANGLPATCQ